MTTLVGYARVSTEDQTLDLQLDALKKAGVDPELLFTDKASGANMRRPGFEELKRSLRKGDTLVVWKLDRLGRSIRELLAFVDWMKNRGVHFRSLTEAFDTSTALGTMIFTICGAFAEMERGMISERTKAGLAAAKARGRCGGRKKSITPEKLDMAMQLLADGSRTVKEVAKQMGVGESTLYRDVRLEKARLAEIDASAREMELAA